VAADWIGTGLSGRPPWTAATRQHAEDFFLDAFHAWRAAAGLDRLGLTPPHTVTLALEDFPTAPAQGALAVQTRLGSDAEALVRVLDDLDVRRAVDAERALLATLEAGCHSAIAALAEVDGSSIRLHAQVFFGEDLEPFDEVAYGTDAFLLGQTLARRALEARAPE
jgi:hydroxymethylbilane synthase